MDKIKLRMQKVIELLSKEERLSVDEIAAQFEISLPTARRMCVQLANEGKAVRIHGGLQRLPQQQSTYSFDQLNNENIEEKRRIARYAMSLVKNNQVIFLEAGTTLLQAAIALSERIKNNELTNVMVFTNSLLNLEVLHPVCNVNMIGGQYRDERKDFIGYMSELAIRGLQFDYCFMGADGISLTKGIMAMDIDTVRFDRELANHSDQVVILAHSAKLYRNSLISFVSIDDVSCIVTDTGISDSVINEYDQSGVILIRV
jgi:DeoR/GlpR family transcriptional regulator of sugar metabolism